MKYTRLGNSDLTVSRVCLGYMGFGDPQKGQHSWTLDEERSREIIERTLELGVNLFGTVIAYQSGTSEQFLGHALKDFTKRKDVAIATKSLPRTLEEIAKGISGQEHIQRMMGKNLENLGVGYVDLYIYCTRDYQTLPYDIVDDLSRVVKIGKIRYTGISNCFAWQLAKANALVQQEGFATFVSIQGYYNLTFREEEREMVPYCREETIALTPYSTLAGGRPSRRPGEVSKRLAKDEYARFKYNKTVEQDQVIIGRVVELADRRNVSMTEAAPAWLLTRVTSSVVDATKLQHIEEAATSEKLSLTDKELACLEDAYVSHGLTGVMAQNRPEIHSETHAWSLGEQKT